MGKSSGTVARLAGVLALLAWAGSGVGGAPGKIGLESMEAAVRLWSDYLWPHACLVFDRVGPTDTERHARRVVRWQKSPSPGRRLARGCAAPRARAHPRRRPHRARPRASLRRRRAAIQAARLLGAGRPAGATLGGQPGLAGRRGCRRRKMSGGKGGKGGNLESLGNRALFDDGANRRKPGGNWRKPPRIPKRRHTPPPHPEEHRVAMCLEGWRPALSLPTLRDAHFVRSSG